MMARGGSDRWDSACKTANPSSLGMMTSSSNMSGWVWSISVKACSPSQALPTREMSLFWLRKSPISLSMAGLSSTGSTRILSSMPVQSLRYLCWYKYMGRLWGI